MDQRPEPRGADYAHEMIEKMRAGTPSIAARKALATAAVRRGNYTSAGKAVFSSWLQDGCE